MTQSYEVQGFLEDAGTRSVFFLRVTGPFYGDSDYFCQVHAPTLLSKDTNIYGVDGEQAKALAIDFVKSLLEGRKLVDDQGMPIAL
jgi:hypothetical protein